MTDPRKRLDGSLQEFMTQHGWSVAKARKSCQIYELPIETTPYVLCEPARRRQDYMEIAGVVGVFHRPFERYWAELHPAGSYREELAFSLHMVNFSTLHEARLISISKIERDTENFGNAILGLLDSFPHDERSLRLAFANGELAGKPIVHFSGYQERGKFQALEEFIVRVQH